MQDYSAAEEGENRRTLCRRAYSAIPVAAWIRGSLPDVDGQRRNVRPALAHGFDRLDDGCEASSGPCLINATADSADIGSGWAQLWRHKGAPAQATRANRATRVFVKPRPCALVARMYTGGGSRCVAHVLLHAVGYITQQYRCSKITGDEG